MKINFLIKRISPKLPKEQLKDDILEEAIIGRQWMRDNQEFLKGVTKLDLHSLELSYLPSEIGLLSELQELNLSKNKLTFLPSQISSLTKIENLFLENNKLTDLPKELSRLVNLKRCVLTGNPLSLSHPTINYLKSQLKTCEFIFS